MNLVIYYATSFCLGLAAILISASSFIIKEPSRVPLTDAQYGLLFIPMVTATALICLCFDFLCKKGSFKRLFATGIFFLIAYHALFFLATQQFESAAFFKLLLASNFALGIGFGILLTSLNILCQQNASRHLCSITTGLHGLFGIGATCSPLFVYWSYQKINWSFGVAFSGILLLGFCLYIFKHLPKHLHMLTPEASEEGKYRFKNHIYFLSLILYGFLEAMIANWAIIYLISEKGFASNQASSALAIFWAFLTLGRLGSSLLVFKIPSPVLYRILPLVLAFGLWLMSQHLTPNNFGALFAIAGLGCSYFFPMTVAIAIQDHPMNKNQIPPLMIAGLMIGVGLGSWLPGVLKDTSVSLTQIFQCSIAIALLLSLLNYITTLPKKS